MRRIILTGYNVGVIPLPPDNGGGRLIQIGAKDGSECYEIAVTDEVWDEFVSMGDRIQIAKPGDLR